MISPLSQLLGHLGGALLALGVCTGVACLLGTEEGLLRQALARYTRSLDHDLRFLRVLRRGTSILLLQAGCCLLLLMGTVLSGLWLGLTAVPLVALLPHHWLQRKREKRVAAIDEQVATFLLALANALRATASIGDALAATERLMPAPISQELAFMLNETDLGTPLDRALVQMGDRIGSKTVRNALGTLRVARRTGGDLPKALETSAASLREMARLEGVLRTKTAEGKSQALVIAILPVPFVGMLQWLSPELIEPLGETSTGHLIVLSAVLCWLAAIVLARKILTVDM